MQTIATVANRVLTETRTRSTPGPVPDIPQRLRESWQKWTAPFQTLGNPELEAMLGHATRFLSEVVSRKSPPRWLSLLGPSGTGKTMLARMLFRFIKEHCLYFSPGYGITLTDQCYSVQWPEATQEMKAGDFSMVDRLIEKESKWDNTKGMTYTYALIDDIGQVEDNSKAYLIGALGRIADARMGSWTIWTANLGLEQLAECLDKRITSRMIRDGNVVVENNCTDYNLR